MVLFDLYVKGGFLMHFIMLCSVIGLSIFVYKLIDYKKLHKEFSNLEVFKSFLENNLKSERDLEIFWVKKTTQIEQGISTINLMANIATLLGLTGTVTGMIKTFMVISTVEFASPKMLAGGIWEALITTASGLFVAIPLHISVHYLERKAEMLISLMKEMMLKTKDEV